MQRRDFVSALGAVAVAPGRAALPAPEELADLEVIDVHLHLFNTSLQGRDEVPRYIDADATVEAALIAMERGRVAKAFLISYAADDVAVQIRQRGVDPAALRGVMSKQYQVAAFRKYPDRFWWFTDHVDPARRGFLEDLDRDFDEGASGVKLLPWFHGVLPDHVQYRHVFELCRKRKKPVILDLSWWYFHLNPLYSEPPVRQRQVRTFRDYARLLAPLFREFADVPISLAHCGTARHEEEYRDIFPLIAAHPNVSCDVAAATGYSARWLERLVAAVGAHKVMYGTDWPYWSSGPESYVAGSRRWRMITDVCPSLTPAQMRQILAGNARRFAQNQLPDSAGTRAQALHARSVVIAIHDHNPIAADLPLMRTGGVTAKVYQVGVDVEIGATYQQSAGQRDGYLASAQGAIEEARNAVAAHRDQCLLALDAADVLRAKREGKTAVMLGVEGGKLLEGRLERLREFHTLGLRELQLRWAVPNQIVEREDLTEFGAKVVAECQRLGVLVDLTHIPEAAFHQAAERLERPWIISHGTGRELGELRVHALARAGGVVGIHFYSSYLGVRPAVLDVLDAVDDLVHMAGIEVVGLGIDLFPSHGAWAEFQRAQGTQDISWAVPNLAHLPEITRGLIARGYTDEEILAILGGNFLRVCRAALAGR